MAVHGYKLLQTLSPFSLPVPDRPGVRVKIHSSGSRLFVPPVHSGSSRNHLSLNRLFRILYALTDKVLNSIVSPCLSDVSEGLLFAFAAVPV